MKNTDKSVYPQNIDPLIFYQDCDIEHKNILGEYYQLIANGHYTHASKLLNNSEIDFYGAWLLNLIENRLRTTEEHIGEFVDDKPLLTIYDALPPSGTEPHWIGKVGGYNYYMFKIKQTVSTGSSSIIFQDDRFTENCFILNFFPGNIFDNVTMDSDISSKSYLVEFDPIAYDVDFTIVVFSYVPWGNREGKKITTLTGNLANFQLSLSLADGKGETGDLNFPVPDITSDSYVLPLYTTGGITKYKIPDKVNSGVLSYYVYSESENRNGILYLDTRTNDNLTEIQTDLDVFVLNKILPANETEVIFEDNQITNDSCFVMFSNNKNTVLRKVERLSANKVRFIFEEMDTDIKLTLFAIN